MNDQEIDRIIEILQSLLDPPKIMQAVEKKPITVKESGHRGGSKTLERYGLEHFSMAGKKGGDSLKASRGIEYYKALGIMVSDTHFGKPKEVWYYAKGSKKGIAEKVKFDPAVDLED